MNQANKPSIDALQFTRNMAYVATKWQKIWGDFLTRNNGNPDQLNFPFTPVHVFSAYMEMFKHLLNDPQKLFEQQMHLWQDYLHLWQHSTEKFFHVHTEEEHAKEKDRRFRDPAWRENVIFDYIRQSYLITARWLQQTVADVEGLDPKTARKIDFYTRQFVDALAPSNFLLTNPEVLRTTLETGGENLVRGLENMLEDMERGKGKLHISMTDYTAFEVGKNLGVTPGKVVFQNDLMQLIQYEPSTKEVHTTPLLLIPAWINKYYVLDLQPENSFINWLNEHGHTVFVISWVNPDEKLAEKSFEDYLLEGPVAALDAIRDATGENAVNCVGYCLGGTLLAITLAWLQAKNQQDRIKSATYLTTMIDFSEAGELSVFIDEDQLQTMESRMEEKGYLDGADMAMTFNMLRANDLIWSFMVNNYLLGREPFPFDLLYWNADSTRMPARMHSFYLRNMYQQNKLATPGALTVAGEKIDLTTITTPSYILSTREDHIAPWASTYAATKIYSGNVTFTLASSGHIAGVINPPERNKYCYWTGHTNTKDPAVWLEHATEHEGSWWPHWQQWCMRYTGDLTKSRKPGDGKLKVIEDAPGSYVAVRT